MPKNFAHLGGLNAYEILGVAPTASNAEIEAAYRRLRSQHHPDRGGDAEQFHRITKAYEEATS